MIPAILAKLFPPKLGYVDRTSVTRHLIETGVLEAIEPDPAGCWAGNVLEYPNGRWRKGIPIKIVPSARPKEILTLIETF